MSIWNKVLLGFVGVASVVFFYTAARALRTQKYWRELEKQFSERLDALEKKNYELVNADEGELEDKTLGILRSQAELNRLLVNRGRVWEKCEPQKVDSKTGEVAVNTDSANPNRISDKMVLYVFEEGEDAKGGHYLGEFKVTDVAENKVGLAPTMTLTERELKRLSGSRGPWMLYELMPTDRHKAFTDLADDERKAMLPEGSLVEYNRDGQQAAADDPKECVVDGKYQRRLRDYKEVFKTCHSERTLFVDMYEALTRDEQYLKDALADAQRQLQFAEQEVAAMKADWALAKKEQKAVGDHQAILESRLAGLQQIVAQRIKENLTIASEIAKIQLDAARRIDERTRTMAQAGAGAN